MLVKLKERHLGYAGCHRLIMDIWNEYGKLPELILLSEFWNGENDIRYDAARYLKSQICHETGMEDVSVIPAEIGMAVRVEDAALTCSQCGKFSVRYRICRPADYGEKLKVICDSCCY